MTPYAATLSPSTATARGGGGKLTPMLLTTREVAALLKVHPKHVYRLRKRGLPAHRVGDEWRFDEEEVRRYCRARGEEAAPEGGDRREAPPPLLAANGDV